MLYVNLFQSDGGVLLEEVPAGDESIPLTLDPVSSNAMTPALPVARR